MAEELNNTKEEKENNRKGGRRKGKFGGRPTKKNVPSTKMSKFFYPQHKVPPGGEKDGRNQKSGPKKTRFGFSRRRGAISPGLSIIDPKAHVEKLLRWSKKKRQAMACCKI